MWADNYIIDCINGMAEKKIDAVWVPLESGDILPGATVIRTTLNSSVVLHKDLQTYTISAMRMGTIDELILGRTTIRIRGSISTTDVKPSTRKTTNIPTASARASEADEDITWEE